MTCQLPSLQAQCALSSSDDDAFVVGAFAMAITMAITMGLTAGRGARNLHSSRVAIGRHSSAVASSHAERLRAARSQGNGPKHPPGAVGTLSFVASPPETA